jgi:hypothetical protein
MHKMIEDIKKMSDDTLVSTYLDHDDGIYDDDLHTGKSEQEVSEFFDYHGLLQAEIEARGINPHRYFSGNE